MVALASRKIGNTDLKVTELGLGCAAMAGNHRPVDDKDIAGAIKEALDLDIKYLDTAPFYGFGRSEHFVGAGLRHKDDYVLSTKAGRLLAPGYPTDSVADEWPGSFPFHQIYDYSYDGVMRSYEDSLQRLGVSKIDILLLHDIGAMQHGESKNKALFADAMSGGYKALDELRSAGDIKAIGLGVNEREVCIEAMKHGQWDAFLLAGRYTLLEQQPLHDLFPQCEEAGTSIILGGPFNSGILVGGDTWNYAKAPESVMTKVKEITRVCESHHIPLPAAALQFPLGSSLVSTVIPGPRSQSEVKQIVEWFTTDIPASLWSDLKTEGLMDEQANVPPSLMV
ncbi:MAG: D-threo-aldose 1-dehydrogenase [Granulosicoccus sp.]|jgi:D-threo-aldose 1-dehydrogenase